MSKTGNNKLTFLVIFKLTFLVKIILTILCIALLCISLGVYLTSETNFVLNPGDGIVKTISEVFHYPFYNVKNMFDISMILCSLVLSWITHNPIMGIGIGTIISAVMIGRLIKVWQYLLQKDYLLRYKVFICVHNSHMR